MGKYFGFHLKILRHLVARKMDVSFRNVVLTIIRKEGFKKRPGNSKQECNNWKLNHSWS